ncbi:TatD family hydrolase [Candidatus Micrarchaeota archaeon]|nr:TatD family hydrolase [Candidatus Micrarchaeota archaeon]
MRIMIVDSHCHLFEMKNYTLSEEVYPVVVGYSHGSNKKVVEIARNGKTNKTTNPSHKYPYPIALGIAPQTALKELQDSERANETKLNEWVSFIKSNEPNAIGEVGLDYKWAQTKADVGKQMLVFNTMIEIADEMELPIVIHSRNNPNDNAADVPKNAIDKIIEMVEGRKFLMHFYSGNDEQAKRIFDMGGYVSIMGLRSKERRKVIEVVPMEKLLVESDCPYVGKAPEAAKDAVAYIAEVKNLDFEEVAAQTTKNAMKFFNFQI